MKRLIFIPVLLGCACLPLYAPAADKSDKEESDVQTLVYLGDNGPVVIRVRLRVDGGSHREAWNAFIDEMFAYLDVDKNGKLSRQEAAGAPPPGVLVSQGGLVGGGGGPDLDADRDGVVTRTEFRNYYRRNGLSPFQISTTSPRGRYRVWLDSGQMNRPTSEALNARLFALLDADKDGKLSKAELEAAPKVLSKLDKDEDEMLAPAEVMGQAAPSDTYSDAEEVFVAFSPDGQLAGNDSRFALLAEGKMDRAMATRLLSRYAKQGKNKVEVKKLGLTKLDRDEDGWLDAEELARLGDLTPDVELIVRVGKRQEKEPFVEVVKRGKSLRKLETVKDGVVATIENARVELRGPDPKAKEGVLRIDAVAQYKTQFEMADGDKNGYLDKQEAGRSPFFQGLFTVMDRDGDGKLYEKEMVAYLNQVAKFRQMAFAGCTSLVVRDQGKGLFDLMDADGDGRLSLRETRNAAKALLKLDADEDGKLALTEVPRSFLGAFEQGAAGVSPLSLAFVVPLGGELGRPALPERTRGPVWHRKMDRNRDGDVSRAEWLGAPEAFDEIDADKDGLLSVEEAEAYDRGKRPKE